MSNSASTPPPSVPKTPFLAAAALFLGVAALIGALAIHPLGAAELLGLLACTAAAAVFTTIPFAIDLTRRLDANRSASDAARNTTPPGIDTDTLAAQIDARLAAALPAFREQLTTALSASLAAAEETRRADIQAAIATTTPPRIHDADTIAPPAPATSGAAKPRLGRGLLGLMHAPSALTAKPATTEPATDDDRAAA